MHTHYGVGIGHVNRSNRLHEGAHHQVDEAEVAEHHVDEGGLQPRLVLERDEHDVVEDEAEDAVDHLGGDEDGHLHPELRPHVYWGPATTSGPERPGALISDTDPPSIQPLIADVFNDSLFALFSKALAAKETIFQSTI